ncbi:MAG: permease, partial [Candidatus Eremiobacteraeota bacterium]|nr:permease [Candidatus Eremiobacteraeota bacterium]
LGALAAGLVQAAGFFWDSLFGLILGFLISGIVQIVLTPATMERFLGPRLLGLVYGAGFGIIASACSYGAAAAARGFYRQGADARAIFAFLISSTNMNLAIIILFWSLLGWRFAFAEFFGGIIIIAIVAAGFTLLVGEDQLRRLQREHNAHAVATASGDDDHCCHRESPSDAHGWRALGRASTWLAIARTAMNDLRMLRGDLLIGYLVAGYAAALVRPEWLAGALHAVGSVPAFGYLLLLIVGLLIAVVTFVCSMGNVPIARYLANAGIPLGANTAFIYGDLLIPPLIAIYRKSFPPRIAWTFVGLFALGAMFAGAVMEYLIGNVFGGSAMPSMTMNDRFTLTSNLLAIAAVCGVGIAAWFGASRTPAKQE